MPRRSRLLLLGLVAGLAFLLYAYLFRTSAIDNTDIGLTYHKYRWGKPYEISVDSNRDGAIDSIVLVEGSFSAPGSEIWEDRDFDGNFEIHANLSNGEVVRVELDQNGDGDHDVVLTGKDAKVFFENFADTQGENQATDESSSM